MDTRHLVILDILPHGIKPEAWADAYDDALALLIAHPARLLGIDGTTIAGVPLSLYTRAIERDRDEASARHWCVAGEQESLAMGLQQTMYRDLRRYKGAATTPLDDIFFTFALAAPPTAAEGPVLSPGGAPRIGGESATWRTVFGVARVLGHWPCRASYALPLLAAAMVIEARFPRWAMVHGDFDRTMAEAAQRCAESVLARPIALPARLEAWRLVERLGARCEDRWLLSAVERMHLAPPETKDAILLKLFGSAATEPWWLGKLRQHVSPDRPGALRLLAAYLEVTPDLGRLCGLACLDARGPRYAPEALMKALGRLRAQQAGAPGPLADASVEQGLAIAFGRGAERLAEVLRNHHEAPVTPAAQTGGPSGGVSAELEGLATLASTGDLTPLQRERVHTLVAIVARVAHRRTDEHPGEPVCAPAPRHLYKLAMSLAWSGPTLTENAWDWLMRERCRALVDFVTVLARISLDADLSAVRRALFENEGLCRYALSVFQADREGRGGRG